MGVTESELEAHAATRGTWNVLPAVHQAVPASAVAARLCPRLTLVTRWDRSVSQRRRVVCSGLNQHGVASRWGHLLARAGVVL